MKAGIKSSLTSIPPQMDNLYDFIHKKQHICKKLFLKKKSEISTGKWVFCFFLGNSYTYSDDLMEVEKKNLIELGKKVRHTTVEGSIQYDFLHLLHVSESCVNTMQNKKKLLQLNTNINLLSQINTENKTNSINF